MLRRDFCRAAGAATGWLLVGGLPRFASASFSEKDIFLQVAIARTFGPGEIVLEISGGVKTGQDDTSLNEGQTYFWRQTVLVENEHIRVYHGRLTSEQLEELLTLYSEELIPFVEAVEEDKKNKKDKKDKDKDKVEDTTGKKGDAGLPERFDLGQNYPNPFSGRTSIPISVPEAGLVEVNVYDMAGRHVASLVDTVLQAGAHAVDWQPDGLPSGTYTIVLKANGASRTRLVTLIR